MRRELLDENKWRATRHGHEASFIDRDAESTITLADAIERTADRVGEDALLDVLDRESGATRQRRIHEESGMDGLCDCLLL